MWSIGGVSKTWRILPAILLIRTLKPGRTSIRGLPPPMAASGFGPRTFRSTQANTNVCTLTCLGFGWLHVPAIGNRETARLRLGGYFEPAGPSSPTGEAE